MDVSDFFFFLLGEGERGVRGVGREGGGFLLKIPGGGGGSPGGGGAEGPGGCLRRIGEFGGWGLNIFFGGPKCPPVISVIISPPIYQSNDSNPRGPMVVQFPDFREIGPVSRICG